MLTNDNNVRRNDLSLRLKYIGIKTRIFKIAPFMYVILCSNIPDDFEKIWFTPMWFSRAWTMRRLFHNQDILGRE